MPKKCKPAIEAVIIRMRAAERLNNRRGGTYRKVFPLSIFGITNPTRTGEFTITDIIKELS
jgi:hypothetical protein